MDHTCNQESSYFVAMILGTLLTSHCVWIRGLEPLFSLMVRENESQSFIAEAAADLRRELIDCARPTTDRRPTDQKAKSKKQTLKTQAKGVRDRHTPAYMYYCDPPVQARRKPEVSVCSLPSSTQQFRSYCSPKLWWDTPNHI